MSDQPTSKGQPTLKMAPNDPFADYEQNVLKQAAAHIKAGELEQLHRSDELEQFS